MQAGQLRHVVILDEPIESQNSTGEEIITWQPYRKIFMAIEPLNGKELALQDGTGSSVNTRLRGRWSPDLARVTPKWRARNQQTVYNIESVINLDTRNRQIQLLCSSGVNDG